MAFAIRVPYLLLFWKRKEYMSKSRTFNSLRSSGLVFLMLLTVGLGCGGSAEPVVDDRSSLSVTKALAGHWKSKESVVNVKNEYYESIPAEAGPPKPKFDLYYKTSWDTNLGEKSDGQYIQFIHSVDEKAGILVLRNTSKDGVYTYYQRYTFNSTRTEFTQEEIDEETGESKWDLSYPFVYAGQKDKADHIK